MGGKQRKERNRKEETEKKKQERIILERKEKVMRKIRYLENRKKWIKGIVCFLTVVIIGGCGQKKEEETTESSSEVNVQTEEITVWYTDPGIADYMNQAAKAYQEQTGITVYVEEQSSIDYLELINQANISEDMTGADLYILNSDSLEKAYLAGLTTETNPEYTGLEDYPEAAVSACIWQGKSCLLYTSPSPRDCS